MENGISKNHPKPERHNGYTFFTPTVEFVFRKISHYKIQKVNGVLVMSRPGHPNNHCPGFAPCRP